MTTKEQLVDLVEQPDETEAAEALELLADRYRRQPAGRQLPRFLGMGHSGQHDLGRRAKEILRDEFGGRASRS